MNAVYHGVVRGNVVVLDDDVRLPQDMVVEIREAPREDASVWERLRRRRTANARYHVGIDEIIEEDRREREEHESEWTGDERLYNALHLRFPFVRFIRDYRPLRPPAPEP